MFLGSLFSFQAFEGGIGVNKLKTETNRSPLYNI